MSSKPTKSRSLEKCLIVVERGRKQSRTVSDGTVTIAVGEHISFNAEILDTFDVKGFTPLHYDLLVLCAAIEFADRRWKRPIGWHRVINITMPVIDLKTWQKSTVTQSLRKVLNHLTGDTWSFSFVQAKSESPIGGRQIPLIFEAPKTFAVAYSAGLDSRAVSALSGKKDEALCLRVARYRQRVKSEDSFFAQIPFKVEGHSSNESSFRSRGFQFAAMTAIAAQLSKIKRVVVPESGQGALGPVLLPLLNIYADYRNHPVFFRKMEQFIKSAQGYKVTFDQPRIFSTKGETLAAFLKLPGKTQEHLTSTHSCWQTRRVVNKGTRKQCGLCAGCLLRRLSLHAAAVNESPDTYVVSNLGATDIHGALSAIQRQVDRDIMVEYGSVGARHLQHLADMAKMPDSMMRTHAYQIASALGETYSNTLSKLRKMLETHATEWQNFLNEIGAQSFLMTWLDGGRGGLK